MFSTWITVIHGKRNCRTPTRHSLHTSIIRDISAGLLLTWQKKAAKKRQQPRHQRGCIWPASFCSFPSFPTGHEVHINSYVPRLTKKVKSPEQVETNIASTLSQRGTAVYTAECLFCSLFPRSCTRKRGSRQTS